MSMTANLRAFVRRSAPNAKSRLDMRQGLAGTGSLDVLRKWAMMQWPAAGSLDTWSGFHSSVIESHGALVAQPGLASPWIEEALPVTSQASGSGWGRDQPMPEQSPGQIKSFTQGPGFVQSIG